MKISLTIAAILPSAVVAKGGPPAHAGGGDDEFPNFEAPDVTGVDSSICDPNAIYTYKCGTEIFVCGIPDNNKTLHDEFYTSGMCDTSKQTGDMTYFDYETHGVKYEDYCEQTKTDILSFNGDQAMEGTIKCPSGKGLR